MRRILAVGGMVGLLAGCSGGSDNPPSRAAQAAAGGPAAGLSTQRLVAAAALAPCPRPGAAPVAVASARSALPTVSLACLGNGPAVALAGLRGPAVVNLWASWCKPCRVEMPRLQALHNRAGSRLLVLGVVTDDDRRNALSAAAGQGVRYPSLLDTHGALRRSFGYPGPPVTLLIDRDGAVVHRILGPLPPLGELLAVVSGRLGLQV